MKFTPSDEQSKAIECLDAFVESSHQYFGLWGYAGTGKTTVIMEFVKRLSHSSVLFCAPTHKATKVLAQKGHAVGLIPDRLSYREKMSTKESEGFFPDYEYSTIHRALGLSREIDEEGVITFELDKSKEVESLSCYKLVIIDEGSMIGSELWDKIQISAGGTQIIVLADPAQLPPVNDEDSVGDDGIYQSRCFSEVNDSFQLTQPQRYSGAISDYALSIRSDLDAKEAVNYEQYLDLDETLREVSARKWLIEWQSRLTEQHLSGLSTDYVKAVCYTNDAVKILNEKARAYLFSDVTDCFHPGDRLILKQPLKINGEISLSNRSDVIVKSAERILMSVTISVSEEKTKDIEIDCWEMMISAENRRYSMYCLDMAEPCKNFGKAKNALYTLAKKEKSKVRWREYYEFVEQFCEVQYGFAITTHSAQGSTYDYAYVAYHDLLRNKNHRERNQLIYTAVTRAAKSCVLSV